MKDFLVLDVAFLVWREFYATAKFDATASIATMLSRLSGYAERFQSNYFVFCFDQQPYLRNSVLPGYKVKKNVNEELAEPCEQVRRKLHDLHDQLIELGFQNVHRQLGYEADDVMASVAANLYRDDRCILISEDCDLYQLLSAQCAVYHPRKNEFITAKSFRAKYGVPPKWWKGAKAIVGEKSDTGDQIPGVKGVGLVTALTYMRNGEVGDGKREKDIRTWIDTDAYRDNLQVVSLPFQGMRAILLQDDSDTADLNDLPARYCRLIGIDAAPTADEQRKAVRSIK